MNINNLKMVLINYDELITRVLAIGNNPYNKIQLPQVEKTRFGIGGFAHV